MVVDTDLGGLAAPRHLPDLGALTTIPTALKSECGGMDKSSRSTSKRKPDQR